MKKLGRLRARGQSGLGVFFEHDVTQRLTLWMTHLLTVTPEARGAYVSQSLCYKKCCCLHVVPHLNPRYLSAISVLTGHKCPICPSVTPVQSEARPGPGRSGRSGQRPSGMGPLLTEMKNAPKFFPSASECSEESSLISPPSLGVPFRMRSAQRLVVLTLAHKKSCSEAA